MTAARSYFEGRAKVGSSGGTGYDHAKRLAKLRGEDEVVETEIPEEFDYLIFWYEEIRGQALRGYGIEPIQFTEIESYARQFDVDMDVSDLELLISLDKLWQNANMPPPPPTPPKPRR